MKDLIRNNRFRLKFFYEDHDMIVDVLTGNIENLSDNVSEFSFDSIYREFEIIFVVYDIGIKDFFDRIHKIKKIRHDILDLTSKTLLSRTFNVEYIISCSEQYSYSSSDLLNVKIKGRYKDGIDTEKNI